jgi:GWxTD domain-containing protein
MTALGTAIGWTILHSLWEGAFIAAALAAALLVIRAPRIRYIAACAALLAALFAFGFTLLYMIPNAPHAVHDIRPSLLTAANGGLVLSRPTPWSQRLDEIAPWLAQFWMLGVLVFYLRTGAALLSIQSLRKRGTCHPGATWQTRMSQLSARLKMTRPVMLLESCFANTPMVIGHLRPVILVPAGVIAGIPAAQMEAILLHELAHIRRHDYLINLIQREVEGFLFYNPAVWWVSKVIRAERENCCDDAAISITGDSHSYALALEALELNRWSNREPAIAATGGNLVKRIRRVLYPQTPAITWAPVLVALVLMATTALALTAWQTPAQNQSAASPRASFYSRWIDQEVVFIVDTQERAAFQALTNDEERDHFIEQFWDRRNPSPGDLNNAFKQEHYRRIAYANQHYRTIAGVSGWQTDRGRIYILNGPPDEIESHPVEGREDWRYHHLNPKGKMTDFIFLDPTGTRDYRLVAPKAE